MVNCGLLNDIHAEIVKLFFNFNENQGLLTKYVLFNDENNVP